MLRQYSGELSRMTRKYDYDAIIIGAGVGGLVCGCYLAKAGLKTLIIEKNAQPGGYCTSFTRKGFKFDACAHSLGSLRKGGNIYRVLKDLGAINKLKIVRHEPSDTILSADYKISFWNNVDNTLAEFKKSFPKESKNITKFFNDIINLKHNPLSALRTKTFKEFIDAYFNDQILKSIISLPILGNAGLPASKISAFTAVVMCNEFMIDGGYYPDGGMQEFPNALLKIFKEYGGDVLFSTLVKGIKIRNDCAEGVYVDRKHLISSRYVISNVDGRQTFLELIGKENIENKIITKLNSLKPSLPIFVLYLGTDSAIGSINPGTNVWYMSHYDIDKMYYASKKQDIDELAWFMIRLSPDKRCINMFVMTSFKNSNYWKDNKKRVMEFLIKKAEYCVPEIRKHIIYKDAATPSTLYRWTLNYQGAAYGWAETPSQLAVEEFSQTTFFKNLYLTGHWTTLVQGTPGVTYLGRSTASIILNKERSK